LLLAAVLFGSACQNDTPPHTINREQAIAVADTYINSRFAPVPPNQVRIATEDRGSNWRVTYTPPEGAFGGVLTVDVSKQSGQVVGFVGGQ
jgi:hypothetical protein